MALKTANIPKPVKLCALTVILVFVYLVIAIPFKVMSVIPGFTDIRPVMLLKPVFGIFFGIPGCIAFAIGNLIGDIMSDSLRWSSIAGFAANFLGPFVFFVFWRWISKEPFSTRTGKSLLKLRRGKGVDSAFGRQSANLFVDGCVNSHIASPF